MALVALFQKGIIRMRVCILTDHSQLLLHKLLRRKHHYSTTKALIILNSQELMQPVKINGQTVGVVMALSTLAHSLTAV